MHIFFGAFIYCPAPQDGPHALILFTWMVKTPGASRVGLQRFGRFRVDRPR